MSAAVEVLEVMRWHRASERSASGSNPVRCVGWREANKVTRKWMDRGAGYYVSIERAAAPFADSRARCRRALDLLCMTGGHCFGVVGCEELDAQEYIAGGSVLAFGGGFGDGLDSEPGIVRGGLWV